MKKIEFKINEYHYTPELLISIYDRDTQQIVEEGIMTLVDVQGVENFYEYNFIEYNPNKSYIVKITDLDINEVIKVFSIEEEKEFHGLA